MGGSILAAASRATMHGWYHKTGGGIDPQVQLVYVHVFVCTCVCKTDQTECTPPMA